MIDRKSLILGSMISLLCLAGYAYAQTHIFNIGLVIEVPEGALELTDVQFDSQGNAVVSKIICEETVTTRTFMIHNTGSKDYVLSKQVSAPPNMEIEIQAYVETSDTDSWGDSSFVLGRGKVAEIHVVVTDNGASAGIYNVELVINAEPQ